MNDALYHAMTMAIAPTGTPTGGPEYQFWREKAVKAFLAMEKAGYVAAPKGSVQFYHWDDNTKRLVRRKTIRARQSTSLLRDADGS